MEVPIDLLQYVSNRTRPRAAVDRKQQSASLERRQRDMECRRQRTRRETSSQFHGCRSYILSDQCQAGNVTLLLGGQHELVSVGVLEDRERAPRLLRRRFHELDASRRQLLPRLLDVVAGQRTIERGAGLRAAFVGHEEDDARVGRSNPQLDPALSVAERLIGEHAKADDVGPEFQRAILIAGRNADELDV